MSRDVSPIQSGPFQLRWYPTPSPGFTGTELFPASGVPGTKVTITGTNLTGATGVLFNGVSAGFSNALTNNVDFRITAIVPPDAVSGPITILTPHGNVTSTASFQVLPPALAIRVTGANEFEIAWPSTSSQFVLESSEDLTGGQWTPVRQLPVRANAQITVTLPVPSGNQFFRLRTN